MDDKSIVKLYFDRDQDAITQTDQKYGRYCYSIAYNILKSKEDAEESVSDTYMTAWGAIPPRRPSVLATFLGKIISPSTGGEPGTRPSVGAGKCPLRWKNWNTALQVCRIWKWNMNERNWPKPM